MSDRIYFKIIARNKIQKNFEYKFGLNEITIFQETGSCVPGRLYFCDPKDICRYLHMGDILVDVTIPTTDPDFRMILDPSGGKYGANKIILGQERDLSDPETLQYMADNGAAIDKNFVLAWALDNLYWDNIIFLIQRIPMTVSRCEIIIKYFSDKIPHNFGDGIKMIFFINYLSTINDDKLNELHKKIVKILYKKSLYYCNFELIKLLMNNNVKYERSAILKLAIEKNNCDFIDFLSTFNFETNDNNVNNNVNNTVNDIGINTTSLEKNLMSQLKMKNQIIDQKNLEIKKLKQTIEVLSRSLQNFYSEKYKGDKKIEV
ncbi:putative ankyrin repeat protein [Cotonvirus japonicus]|uniref:Ankyrin repeat protein n=1 Tax=Cotonvirus japonicus TaxID=2811091 RepID=A0ABM7NRC7_9VIRU|nr:putative ankyrin repeat protein [Cotonvirus japonicus]BCS82715.1 putative ankyrin repeat protein [Cotonvirus japonicus]